MPRKMCLQYAAALAALAFSDSLSISWLVRVVMLPYELKVIRTLVESHKNPESWMMAFR